MEDIRGKNESDDLKVIETRDKIRASEQSFKEVYSVKMRFSDHLMRYSDEKLPDMYDHNQFVPEDQQDIPTTEEFDDAVSYQKEKELHFIKYESRTRLPELLFSKLKEKYGIECDTTYTMYLPGKDILKWKINENVEVCDIHDNVSKTVKDITCIEHDNYAEIYGENFLLRKVRRETDAAIGDRDYHYLVAYLDGTAVGACYAFAKNGCIQIDDLIVNKSARKKYVATTLLAYIADNFDGIMYLHADEDDTPKDMYAKMGFEIIDLLYEYSASWDK